MLREARNGARTRRCADAQGSAPPRRWPWCWRGTAPQGAAGASGRREEGYGGTPLRGRICLGTIRIMVIAIILRKLRWKSVPRQKGKAFGRNIIRSPSFPRRRLSWRVCVPVLIASLVCHLKISELLINNPPCVILLQNIPINILSFQSLIMKVKGIIKDIWKFWSVFCNPWSASVLFYKHSLWNSVKSESLTRETVPCPLIHTNPCCQ